MSKATAKLELIVLFCLIVSLIACNNKRDTPTLNTAIPTVTVTVTETIPEGTDISFTTIEQNDWGYGESLYGDFENQRPALFAITRLEDIGLANSWITPETQQKLQTTNYDTDFVLVAFQGLKPSNDYGVHVEHITIQNGVINVFASFKEPEPELEVLTIETSPYQVIRVSKGGNWIANILFNLIVDENIVASYTLDTPIAPTVAPYPPLMTP